MLKFDSQQSNSSCLARDRARSSWSINGRFLAQTTTGVQRYAMEAVRYIDEALGNRDSEPHKSIVELIVPRGCQLPFDLKHIRVRSLVGEAGYLWEQVRLPLACPGGLLNLANLGPLAMAGRQITCIHDANVFLAPESYTALFRAAYRFMLPSLGRISSAVVTVSQFSARSLEQAGVTRTKTELVFPNGHEHALRWKPERSVFSNRDQFLRPFVLALASRAKHKNLQLLEAVAPQLDQMGLDVLIVGGSSSLYIDPDNKGQSPNVKRLGFVSDDDLAALFSHAICLAFPSKTEGFGLPLLEAMVHRCPIVASATASMPEVGGIAALYAAPDDPAAWIAQISRLKNDENLRRKLISNGLARYPQFSWRETGRAYLELGNRFLGAERGRHSYFDGDRIDLKRGCLTADHQAPRA